MIMNNSQNTEYGVEKLSHVPPPCWYIEYNSHGQITLRQDDADSALANGAIRVTAYGHAAPLVAPLTRAQLSAAVDDYSPQSEDEEVGFRDGFRAAERHYSISAMPEEHHGIPHKSAPAP
jgi:hypothetical protein